MNEQQVLAKWALHDWAEGAGVELWEVRDAERGEAYRLYWGSEELFYCSVPAKSDYTTVLIHGVSPADVEPLYEFLVNQRRSDESRDGTRVRVYAREMPRVASWNRARLNNRSGGQSAE